MCEEGWLGSLLRIFCWEFGDFVGNVGRIMMICWFCLINFVFIVVVRNCCLIDLYWLFFVIRWMELKSFRNWFIIWLIWVWIFCRDGLSLWFSIMVCFFFLVGFIFLNFIVEFCLFCDMIVSKFCGMSLIFVSLIRCLIE